MKPLKIITIPNPLLRQISKPVSKIDPKILKFIKTLENTLSKTSNPPGVGLSAIQTATPLQIFCTLLPNQPLKTYINPQIISKSIRMTLGGPKTNPFLEGCLSIPTIYGAIKRHKWIKLKWLDKNNQTHTQKFSDFPARVIQHELDHLNGILFTDHFLKNNLPLFEKNSKNQLNPIHL